MKYFTFIYYTFSHLSIHLSIMFCHVTYLHLQHVNIFLLRSQQFFKIIFHRFSLLRYLHIISMFTLRFIPCSQKRSLSFRLLLFFFSIIPFFFFLLHIIKQVNNFLRSILNNIDQISLLKPSINNNLRYFRPKFFIFLTSFSKICNITPQLPPILKIN